MHFVNEKGGQMQIFLAITFIGLVVLAISALGGHHEFGGHEISFDHGHDIGHDAHGDTEGSPSFLSTRILSLFAVAFGAIGTISTAKGVPSLFSILFGLGGGSVIGYLGLQLMRLIYSQQANSTVSADEFLAQYGEVHTEIPPTGYGQVSVVVRGQRFYQLARSKGGISIPRGTRVFIAEHNGTQMVVEPMEDYLLSE